MERKRARTIKGSSNEGNANKRDWLDTWANGTCHSRSSFAEAFTPPEKSAILDKYSSTRPLATIARQAVVALYLCPLIWNDGSSGDDDFDVQNGKVVIGRVYKVANIRSTPWFWTYWPSAQAGFNALGHAESKEAAMAELAENFRMACERLGVDEGGEFGGMRPVQQSVEQALASRRQKR